MKSKTTLTKTFAVLACAAALASCAKRKDNNVNQLSSLGTATVSGRVTARLVDTAGAAEMQYAPAGKVIGAWVDTRDYVVNADPSASYARKYYSTTTDANGYYSFAIEVSPYKSATVHVIPSDFEANVLKLNSSGETYTERKVFHADPVSERVVSKDQVVIADVDFN